MVSGLKLVSLSFISKNETAHSIIDLIDVDYQTPDGKWHPVDEAIDGHYNQPPPCHNLSVESVPIDGINFIIDVITYTTNETVELEEGRRFTVSTPSIWKVGTDQYIFRHWEDNSTNLVRVVSLTSNITITSTYELATIKYILTVNSRPITGINFTIGTATYTTNTSVSLLEGFRTVTLPSVWTVDNDTYIFRHLQQSGGKFTSPETIIPLLFNETITAIYELVLAPVASFTFLPAEPTVGETMTFNASASNDPDGTIINYDWNFDWLYASDSGVIVEHAFTVARTYYVTLTVTDNDGLSHTVEKVITIKEAPPSGIPLELYLITVAVIAIIIIAIAFYYVMIKRRARILLRKIH